MTIYAIGDIHGQLDLLCEAHGLVEADRAREGTADARVVHVGDLVDRGTDSAGVIERLRKVSVTDARVVVLKGNHDAMMLAVLDDPTGPALPGMLASGNGFHETLRSYGIEPSRSLDAIAADIAAHIPPSHHDFLADLPLWHIAGDCLFVHAGLRPGIPMNQQSEEDLTWIREDFLHDRTDHGRLVVHGHTQVDQVEHHGNRLAIDTGAARGRPITPVAIEGRAAFILTETGRRPVRRIA